MFKGFGEVGGCVDECALLDHKLLHVIAEEDLHEPLLCLPLPESGDANLDGKPRGGTYCMSVATSAGGSAMLMCGQFVVVVECSVQVEVAQRKASTSK